MSPSEKFTLQTLSIGCIVDNFERFYFAYTTSKDARLQQNLQFLQRRFSYDLAHQLLANGEKTDDYFDFLINEHLTLLHFTWFRDSRYLRSMEEIFSRVTNLKYIMMSEGDQVLKYVARFCPKLTQIDAPYSFVTDRGIKYLCEPRNGTLPCPELKSVNISKSRITKRGAKRLIKSLPALESFNYPNLPLVLRSIYRKHPYHPPSFNLTELDLASCKDVPYSSEIIKTCLKLCPNLESITCHISEKEQLSALASSRGLKSVDLRFSKANINIDKFLRSSGCSVRTLKLTKCTVSFSALATHCPALKDLTMDNVSFKDNDYDSQSNFPSLTKITLRIRNAESIAKACRLLSVSSTPKLETMTFSTCLFSPEAEREILNWCKNSTVKDAIFISINPITVEFFKDFLLHCLSLKQFAVLNCNHNPNRLSTTLNDFAESLPNKPKIGCF